MLYFNKQCFYEYLSSLNKECIYIAIKANPLIIDKLEPCKVVLLELDVSKINIYFICIATVLVCISDAKYCI